MTVFKKEEEAMPNQLLESQPLSDPKFLAPETKDTVSHASTNALSRAMLGEFVGTFVLVFFGVGVVNAAVVTGAQVGLWQVAVVWAIGVSLGIFSSNALSGAHLNPAITLVSVVYDRFPIGRAISYAFAQVAGAMAASMVLYAMFAESILEFERRHGLLRGGPASERSAMVFGEYFPIQRCLELQKMHGELSGCKALSQLKWLALPCSPSSLQQSPTNETKQDLLQPFRRS